MCEVNNKTVVITGAADGMGLAEVHEFLKQGAKHVIGLDINEEKCLQLQSEFDSKYGDKRARFLKCDVTKDLEAVLDRVWKEYGYVDVLVNNAGVGGEDVGSVDLVVATNFLAVIKSSHKAFNLMHRGHGGAGGTIINVGSGTAFITLPPFPVYSATKAGLLKFSNCLGSDLYYEQSGVRVVCVCYGGTHTSIVSSMDRADKFLTEEAYRNMSAMWKVMPMQSAETAAQCMLEVYKKADSGTTWMVDLGKVEQVDANKTRVA